MSLNRLELDGSTSPTRLAERIHELEPDLPSNFNIHALCAKLDIAAIRELEVNSFEAALLTDQHKRFGEILLAKGRRTERHRFSIGHELGHFLLPHMPQPGKPLSCSLADLQLTDPASRDRHKRTEAEANRFAAALLMPPRRLREAMTTREPNLGEIVELARAFGVSKEAMARSYVDAHRATTALLILRHGQLERSYRPAGFPWITPNLKTPIPQGSLAEGYDPRPRELTAIETCEPEVWFDERTAASIDGVTEQLLGQSDGYAMLLLRVEGEDY